MNNSRLTIENLINDPALRNQYLKDIDESIRLIFINNTLWNTDARNAALTAIKALEYLYMPTEEKIVIKKKPSFEEWMKNGG